MFTHLLALTLGTVLLIDVPAGNGSFPSPDEAARCVQPTCPTVVRVQFDSPEQITELATWTEPWEISRDRQTAVLEVDAAGLERLRGMGARFAIDHDLTARLCRPRTADKTQQTGIPDFPCYRTVEETFASAQALTEARPDLASWIDVGDSWEKLNESPDGPGYDIMVLRLTNRATEGTGTPHAPGSKPILLATGGIHAREYAPPELLMQFAEELVSGHGHDADATWLLDEHEIHLMLYANPDGRKRAETGILWRKNADNNFCTGTDERGVDLNRNFEYGWNCCGGSSGEPCNEIYRGPSPASEPETQVVQHYLRSIFPDQWDPEPDEHTTGVYLDVHSYGELVLWPWGAVDERAPNHQGLQTLGRRLAYQNGYLAQQGISFYPVDGSTVDFAYGDLGVAAYTIEVGAAFFQPCTGFRGSVLPRNLRALRYAAKVARNPYVTPSGPVATFLELESSGAVPPGEPVHLTLWLNDSFFRSTGLPEPTQPIVAGQLWIDHPPWRPGAPEPLALLPVDGAFDADREQVEVWIDTTGLAHGRHILFTRGQDESGTWGAVGAVFLDVVDPDRRPRTPARRVER